MVWVVYQQLQVRGYNEHSQSIHSSRTSEFAEICLLQTGYNAFLTTLNRSIPMAIAIYRYITIIISIIIIIIIIIIIRYCCVFYNNWLLDTSNKKRLENGILMYLIGEILCSLLLSSDSQLRKFEHFHTISIIITMTASLYMSGTPLLSTFLMLRPPYYMETRRYNICRGREEAFLYDDLDFFNDHTVGPITRIPEDDPTK